MQRPSRLLILAAGATLVVGGIAAPYAGAANGPRSQARPAAPALPTVVLPPIDPCLVHPFGPGCGPGVLVDPCIQSPNGCPQPTTTTTTTPPEDEPDPEPEPEPEVDTPSAEPATAVAAAPTFTG